MQCWLAQEQLWIQHALIRSVRAINKPIEESFDPAAKDYDGAKPWILAPIKRMHRIEIGPAALAQPFTSGQVKELVEYQASGDPQQQQGGSGSASGDIPNLIAKRYLEKNEQFRLIPVSIHLLVDQAKIAEVLGGLANTDFNFTILEVRQTYPQEKIKLPILLEKAGVNLPGRGADNPLYNCMDLDVYGTMRIYEMPAAMKEKRTKAASPGEAAKSDAGGNAPPPSAAAPTASPPPPATDAKPAEEKKSDDKQTDSQKPPEPTTAAAPAKQPDPKSEPKKDGEPKPADSPPAKAPDPKKS
jgi:hypothetical protein